MKRILSILALALVLAGCIPSGYQDASQTSEALEIYPDYTGVVMPVNIAPMNFEVLNAADACVVEISYAGQTVAVKGPVVSVPVKKWHAMLEAAKGGELVYKVYVKRDGKWLRFAEFSNTVAPDPIDEYVTYRLIEPGYSYYGQILLRQRHLTDFKEVDLYNNSLISQPVQQQCINCHSFQNYSTENFQFHARNYSGGTIVVTGDKAKKLEFKTGDLISNGVYPSWHPTEPLIAYSLNLTQQIFFTTEHRRLEVFDLASDLCLYDVNTDAVSYIVHDSLNFETFPYWAPDGKTLYYSSAYLPSFGADSKTDVTPITRDIRYGIYAIDFDPATRAWGEPCVIYDAPADSLSAVTPRPSPDGRYLLSGVGSFGSFHIWHDTGDIYLTDLQTLETRPLEELNTERAESFKSWASNSRWIAFTSRREDGTYTRLYLAYFDEQGNAHKPFLLPQEDPEQNHRLFKSYNVPEFTKDQVRWDPKALEKVVLSDPVRTHQVEPASN
ncbi:MAG: PD40 domain-containing protein [Bacteroidales bacterium]|nr:PD40 domain-containing protein [Bacteroidales bacterium]